MLETVRDIQRLVASGATYGLFFFISEVEPFSKPTHFSGLESTMFQCVEASEFQLLDNSPYGKPFGKPSFINNPPNHHFFYVFFSPPSHGWPRLLRTYDCCSTRHGQRPAARRCRCVSSARGRSSSGAATRPWPGGR